MTLHKWLVKQAMDAIRAVNGDTSVDQETTLEDLTTLADEIENMKQGIREKTKGEC